jgi:hypothetical protein
MPKNKVTDLITDQEMAFAHLVLSGTMTVGSIPTRASKLPEYTIPPQIPGSIELHVPFFTESAQAGSARRFASR